MLCVSRWKCFQFSCVELIDLKIARPHEQDKVINYRLIEEHSQTFNERLFLPYCKLYNKCILKSANFPFKTSSLKTCALLKENLHIKKLLDFSLTVKAVTLIFIPGCCSAISSAKEGKSGLIYNLVNS